MSMTKRVKGTDEFRFGDDPLSADLVFDVTDFWEWYISDLSENTTRGGLGEFLVARALGVHREQRAEWENYDVVTNDGTKIEVKTTGYTQTWHQNNDTNSSIVWDIAPKLDSYGRISGKKRWADVYVLCLHTETDPSRYDSLDLSKWEFYVLHRKVLDRECSDQKSIRLNPLKELGAESVNFTGLKAAILRAANAE